MTDASVWEEARQRDANIDAIQFDGKEDTTKAWVYNEFGKKVVIVNEAYTNTCSCCGSIHPSLGGSKIYECQKCNKTMDRDVNGAKIFRNCEALED